MRENNGKKYYGSIVQSVDKHIAIKIGMSSFKKPFPWNEKKYRNNFTRRCVHMKIGKDTLP